MPFTTHLVFFERLTVGLNAVFEDLEEPPIDMPFLNHLGRNNRPASFFFDERSEKLLDKKMVEQYSTLKDKLGDKPYLRL